MYLVRKGTTQPGKTTKWESLISRYVQAKTKSTSLTACYFQSEFDGRPADAIKMACKNPHVPRLSCSALRVFACTQNRTLSNTGNTTPPDCHPINQQCDRYTPLKVSRRQKLLESLNEKHKAHFTLKLEAEPEEERVNNSSEDVMGRIRKGSLKKQVKRGKGVRSRK